MDILLLRLLPNTNIVDMRLFVLDGLNPHIVLREELPVVRAVATHKLFLVSDAFVGATTPDIRPARCGFVPFDFRAGPVPFHNFVTAKVSRFIAILF